MYGRFSGVRQVAWRVVKEMSFVSVAVYSFTGMFTRPNEMLPLQIARADGMETPVQGGNSTTLLEACPPRSNRDAKAVTDVIVPTVNPLPALIPREGLGLSHSVRRKWFS